MSLEFELALTLLQASSFSENYCDLYTRTYKYFFSKSFETCQIKSSSCQDNKIRFPQSLPFHLYSFKLLQESNKKKQNPTIIVFKQNYLQEQLFLKVNSLQNFGLEFYLCSQTSDKSFPIQFQWTCMRTCQQSYL